MGISLRSDVYKAELCRAQLIPKIYQQLLLENRHSNNSKTQISTPLPHHDITATNIRAYSHCLVKYISKILTFRLEICFNQGEYIVKYVEYLRIMTVEKYPGIGRIKVIWRRSAKANQLNGALHADGKYSTFSTVCSAQGCTYLTKFVAPAAYCGSPFWDLWICAWFSWCPDGLSCYGTYFCPTHRDKIGETIANDLSKFIHDAAAMFIPLPDGCKFAHVWRCQNMYQQGRGGV